ncbi:MAG: DUF47 domain-containing protein [Thermoanaerobaculia bacterium]
MFRFLPRDDQYFERFTELAQRIHESARILNRFLGEEEPLPQVAERIKTLEHECDQISHEILRRIDRTFITPIDREDIHQLAVRLDDVIDLIDGTVRRLSLFHIATPTLLSKTMGGLIVEATREVVEAVSVLKKMKGVIPHCIAIKRLENQGDAVFHDAVASLFTDSLPAIEVIKWKDVYENMERCMDQCEAVAHVLQSVVLKNT